MYLILKVILIGYSLLARENMLACPTSMEKTTLKEVPSLIEPLRKQLVYEDNNKKNVKPKLPNATVIYRLKHSGSTKLYLFSVSDVEDVYVAGGFTGLAGPRVFIYEINEVATVKKLFDFNVVEIYGTIGGSSGFPDLFVLLHGGRFNRPGEERGVGLLKFNNRKYEYVVDRKEIDQTKLKMSCAKFYKG